MANTLVQFRADETERAKAAEICAQLGLDLPSYLRMCMLRLVREKGIPFEMKISDVRENNGVQAMKHASRIAQEYGISEMSLDEIYEEIAGARK